ncbi:MAG: hypothetical protein AAF184_15555 [Pseudomonadota bacterium]
MRKSTRVVLCATLSIAAAGASAADDASRAAATADDEAQANQTSYSYTWDELVELIPDIRDMHLVKDRKSRRQVADPNEVAGTTKLCRRERTQSMIKRRVCFTLDEYVEQYVEARKYYAELASGQMTRGFLGEGGGATATDRTSYP